MTQKVKMKALMTLPGLGVKYGTLFDTDEQGARDLETCTPKRAERVEKTTKADK